MGLHPNREQFLAIKWIIVAARERQGKRMSDKLATELLDAYNNEVLVHLTCIGYNAFFCIYIKTIS